MALEHSQGYIASRRSGWVDAQTAHRHRSSSSRSSSWSSCPSCPSCSSSSLPSMSSLVKVCLSKRGLSLSATPQGCAPTVSSFSSHVNSRPATLGSFSAFGSWSRRPAQNAVLYYRAMASTWIRHATSFSCIRVSRSFRRQRLRISL
jgi:hypothetical protein